MRITPLSFFSGLVIRVLIFLVLGQSQVITSTDTAVSDIVDSADELVTKGELPSIAAIPHRPFAAP
jgi:hypothetical protein